MIKRFVLALSILTSFVIAQQQAPETSDFSLTVYSTADPATFDPQELARQQALPVRRRAVQRPPRALQAWRRSRPPSRASGSACPR